MSKRNPRTTRAEILRKRSESRANLRVRSIEQTIDLTNTTKETKIIFVRLITPIKKYFVKTGNYHVKANSKAQIKFEVSSRVIPIANELGLLVKDYIPKPKIKSKPSEPEKTKEVEK